MRNVRHLNLNIKHKLSMLSPKKIVLFSVLAALIIMILLSADFFSDLTAVNCRLADIERDDRWIGLAQSRLAQRGYADLAYLGYGLTPAKTIGGRIENIRGDRLILAVNDVNVLSDPDLDRRTVKLAEVDVYWRREKSEADYVKDLVAFNQKNADGLSAVSPPEKFITEKAAVDALAVGQRVMIAAAENIHRLSEFQAKDIYIIVNRE